MMTDGVAVNHSLASEFEQFRKDLLPIVIGEYDSFSDERQSEIECPSLFFF